MSTSGILSGSAIDEAICSGQIKITPFRKEFLNPGSYDLTLGRKVAVYKNVTKGSLSVSCLPSSLQGNWGAVDGLSGDNLYPNPEGHLDAATPNEVLTYELALGEPFLLKPEIGYLLHTEEAVWTDSFVPVLDGKSSVGRLFTSTHVTAGFGEAGFDGQYTLEVVVTHPTIVYAGMRFCQIRFHTIVGEKQLYAGNYVGNDARGPIPSKSWKQIADDKLLARGE